MSAGNTAGVLGVLALAGMAAFPPVAPALEAQEYAGIESQCRREAHDYGVAPEQTEDYVTGCILANGGTPVALPQEDGHAGADAVDDPGAGDLDMGEQDLDEQDVGEQDTDEQGAGTAIE
jgi:hypothetical protein